MSFIKVINYEESEGELRVIYNELLKKRGKLADVHTIQSLNPQSIVTHMEFYMSIMFGQSPLSRAQREMIAVVVSAANECVYCQAHHSVALNNYWKNEVRISQLKEDFRQAALSPKEEAICQYAIELTKNPKHCTSGKQIEVMKEQGLNDREILDTSLVTAYFNFVNRMVMGLGVELEQDQGKGYHY